MISIFRTVVLREGDDGQVDYYINVILDILMDT
jgi:hypothetical protein